MTDFIGMILLSLVSSLTYIIIIRSINRMKLFSHSNSKVAIPLHRVNFFQIFFYLNRKLFKYYKRGIVKEDSKKLFSQFFHIKYQNFQIKILKFYRKILREIYFAIISICFDNRRSARF